MIGFGNEILHGSVSHVGAQAVRSHLRRVSLRPLSQRLPLGFPYKEFGDVGSLEVPPASRISFENLTNLGSFDKEVTQNNTSDCGPADGSTSGRAGNNLDALHKLIQIGQ